MSRVDEALALFEEGFLCSQAVLAPYAVAFGMDKDTALKVSQGLGGGMGGMRRECGCATGAYMVISLFCNNTIADSREAKIKTFRLVKEFQARLEKKIGTTVCGELLQGKAGSYEVCNGYVREACLILETMLEEEK